MLRRQAGDVGVGQGLRDDGEADGDTGYQVADGFLRVVSGMEIQYCSKVGNLLTKRADKSSTVKVLESDFLQEFGMEFK